MENTQKKRLIGAAAIVMSSMIVSRITGFLRSALIPNMMVEVESDALFAAFRTTDVMYNLLVGGAIAAALIPVLSGYLAKDREEDGWKAVGSFINLVCLAMVATSLFGIAFAPQVISVTAPGLTEESRLLAISLTRILFPSVAFIMLAGMTNGVLNSYQRFAAAAYGPSIYNTGTVISILLFSKHSVKLVAVGIMISACIYFLFQFSFAFRNFRYYRPHIYFRHEGFKKLIRLASSSLAASSIAQINVIVSQSYTSFFEEGSLTAYSNANDIWQLPYGIFAMGLGTAVLPTLSEKAALGDRESFIKILEKGLMTILAVAIPSAVAFVILKEPIISGIFKWSGNFTKERVELTGNILMMFTPALFAQSTLALTNRAFYASNDTRTPLIFGASSTLMNGILCNLFFRYTALGAAGMSLAFSISSLLNAIVILYILNRRLEGLKLKSFIAYILKLVFASLIMGCVIFAINLAVPVDFSASFSVGTKLVELAVLAIEVAAGAAVYFGIVLLMGIEEARNIYDMVMGRISAIIKRKQINQN